MNMSSKISRIRRGQNRRDREGRDREGLDPKRRRGIALVLVIGFMVLVSVILATSVKQLIGMQKWMRAEQARVQAQQWMLSGVERAQAIWESNPNHRIENEWEFEAWNGSQTGGSPMSTPVKVFVKTAIEPVEADRAIAKVQIEIHATQTNRYEQREEVYEIQK